MNWFKSKQNKLKDLIRRFNVWGELKESKIVKKTASIGWTEAEIRYSKLTRDHYPNMNNIGVKVMKFKVGDRVEATEGSPSFYDAGDKGTIAEVNTRDYLVDFDLRGVWFADNYNLKSIEKESDTV